MARTAGGAKKWARSWQKGGLRAGSGPLARVRPSQLRGLDFRNRAIISPEKHEISEKIDFFDFLALLATLAKRADFMTGKLAPKRRFSRFLVGKRGPYGEGKNGTFLEGSFSEIWGEKNAFFCTSSVSENFEKIPDPEAFFWTLPETAAK